MTTFALRSSPAWLGLLLAMGLSPACTSNVADEVALAQLAQGCLINSDCEEPLVCAFESCHVQCTDSRDCEDGARCVGAERPYKVCQLESERLCQTTADCASPLVCGVDGECRDSCRSDRDCIEGQLCVSGTCADTDELDADGKLTPADGLAGQAEGAPCVYVSDCSGALLCRGQVCQAECKQDLDCASAQSCSDTRCQTSGEEPVSCRLLSDCDADGGEICANGSCRCSCVEDRDCPENQLCDGCGCVADPDGPAACQYNSDCEVSGQQCVDGACRCECREDVDCASGESCDGCGCVDVMGPSYIVYGDVRITGAVQLERYRNVREIHGNLSILVVDAISDAGGVFDQLETVTGRIEFSGNAFWTQLDDFPKLHWVGELFVLGNGSVVTLSFPALTEIMDGSLAISEGQLVTLQLPALEQVNGDVLVNNCLALSDLTLPMLQQVAGEVSLKGNPALDTVTMPELESAAVFELRGTSGASVVDTLSVPQLKGLGELDLRYTRLTTLAGLDPALSGQIEGATLYGLTVTSNANLSRCAAEHLLSSLVSDGFAGSSTISSNLACTTCVAEACGD
ncbi:MAG TPA: hypothetical protein VLC09_21100 [Polyangiaceae bacterium]|nr:hypothetical protein [Polyangiaceae bacterium]